MVSPDNPTGRIISNKTARELAEIAIDNEPVRIYAKPRNIRIKRGCI